MERFMIGHFGRYNEEKQIRDFRNDFFGVEICSIEDDSDIEKLFNKAEHDKFKIGIHFPLKAGGWRLRDPQCLSKDEEIKKSSYEYIENQISLLKNINIAYILFHYPKPVLLDERVDWSNWRFADDTEYYWESEYPYEFFRSNSEEFFKRLNDISIQHNFTPVLEFDAVNKYIYESDLVETLLEKYPRIRLCLDIGRLHLQDKLDENFDVLAYTKRFAKHTEVIHLWNVKVSTNLENSHYPALPDLSPEEGWADVEAYLSLIGKENKNCKILFEHSSDLITDEELDCCYNWVESILRV